MIWTDLEVSDFSWSSPRLRSAFTFADTFAEKADILRLEILYQFGGIYSDTDVLNFIGSESFVVHLWDGSWFK